MKNYILLFFLAICFGSAKAQPNAAVAARKEMKLFSAWPGIWKGESVSQMGPTTKASHVEEHIQLKLDSSLILFEGTGKTEDPVTHQEKTVHNALGLLSYDVATRQYKMKSYLADGRSTDAWFVVLSDHHYQWGFDSNPGKVRYSITINLENTTWKEVGEYSKDGMEFQKFFEMNLRKQ